MSELVATASPRICVMCLASYNAGRHHTKWIELGGVDEDEVWDEINTMLKSSPVPFAEEWIIADAEYFGDVRIREGTSVADVVAIADAIAEHGEEFGEILARAMEVTKTIEDAIEAAENASVYESEEDYARTHYGDYLENLSEEDFPSVLRYNMDWEGVARSLLFDVTSVDLSGGRIAIL